MIHLRPRHRRRQKRKKKTLNHRNKVKKNELVFERNDQSFWVACGSIFALLVRLQSFWQQCIEHTMPQEKKKKTACPVFFTVQVAFPFLCKILSLYLCVCVWMEGEKFGKKRPKRFVTGTLLGLVSVGAKKEVPGLGPHCVTHKTPRHRFILGTNIPHSLYPKKISFFFFLLAFSHP